MNIKKINISHISLIISFAILVLGILVTHKGPTIIEGNIHDVMIPKIAAEAFNTHFDLHQDIKSGFGYFYFALHGLTQKIIMLSPYDYFKNHNSVANLLFLIILLPFYFILKKIKLFDPQYSTWILPFLLSLVFCAIDIDVFDHRKITWYASYNYHSWSLYFLLLFSTFYLIQSTKENEIKDIVYYIYGFISALIFGFLFYYKFNYAIGVGSIFAFGLLQMKNLNKIIKLSILFISTFVLLSVFLSALGYNIYYYLQNIQEISSVRGTTLAFKKKVYLLSIFFILYFGIHAYRYAIISKFSNLLNLKTLSYIGLVSGFSLCLVGDFNQPLVFVFVFLLVVINYEYSFYSQLLSKTYLKYLQVVILSIIILGSSNSILAQVRTYVYRFKDVSQSKSKELITIKSYRTGLPSEDSYIILSNIYGFYDIAERINGNEHIIVKLPNILPTSDKMFELKDYVASVNESTDYIQNLLNEPEGKDQKILILEFTNHAIILNDNVLWPKGLLHWVHPGTTIDLKNMKIMEPAYEDSDYIFISLIGVDPWTNKVGCKFIEYNDVDKKFNIIDYTDSWLVFTKNKTPDSSKVDTIQQIESSFRQYCEKVNAKK